MRVIKLSLLCLLFSFSGKAQDTLFFKYKQKLVVIVKEVSPTEIQYKKLELPDGPMYIVSKNDIDKIVYKNGYTDVFKQAPEEPKAPESFVVYNNNPEENLNYEKITYQDAKARHYRLVSLVDRHPDVKRRDNLKIDLKTMRNLKKHQGGTRTMAIVFGGVAIGGVAMYSLMSAASYGGIVDPVFAMQPMIFGALGLGFGVGSIALTVKLNEKRKEFVNRYNE
ncbi:MAG: hypothetical protein K0S53_2603 [Bacteroidetes bacterium]|jgi:hypothetical protein|nr:hypothetical protein [Bacteroidota bacterium]